jgi:hypothetical protein
MNEKYKIEFDFAENEFNTEGFTPSGRTKYESVLKEYASLLFEQSKTHGDVDKIETSTREVTHNHVKQATLNIANSFGKPKKTPWYLQFGQLISGIVLGVTGNNIKETPFLIVFVAFFVTAIFLFILERKFNK